MPEKVLERSNWVVMKDAQVVDIFKGGSLWTSFALSNGQVACMHKVNGRVPKLPEYIQKKVKDVLSPVRAVVKLNGTFVTDHPNKNYAIKAAKEVKGPGVVTVHLKGEIIWSKEIGA